MRRGKPQRGFWDNTNQATEVRHERGSQSSDPDARNRYSLLRRISFCKSHSRKVQIVPHTPRRSKHCSPVQIVPHTPRRSKPTHLPPASFHTALRVAAPRCALADIAQYGALACRTLLLHDLRRQVHGANARVVARNNNGTLRVAGPRCSAALQSWASLQGRGAVLGCVAVFLCSAAPGCNARSGDRTRSPPCVAMPDRLGFFCAGVLAASAASARVALPVAECRRVGSAQ